MRSFVIISTLCLVAAIFASSNHSVTAEWAGFGSAIKSDSLIENSKLVVAGDFDGDGVLDLATGGNDFQATVAVLHGKGNGAFGPGTVTNLTAVRTIWPLEISMATVSSI